MRVGLSLKQLNAGGRSTSTGRIGLHGTQRPGHKKAYRPRAGSIRAKVGSPSTASLQPARQIEREAILCQRLKGHSAAVTALLVSSDTDATKEIVSSSLDKSMVLWRMQRSEEEPEVYGRAEEVVRMTPAGAPVFSLAAEVPQPGEQRHQIFCGNAARSVVGWDLPSAQLQDKVVLNGHTGWVRAVATDGRWLYSCGCNYLRQWDVARAVPRHMRDVKLFTGDIQGLETGAGRIFSCGADGSIRSWEVTKKGELKEAASREKAHKERVAAILYHSGFLYSVSWDGSVKMWDSQNLELVRRVFIKVMCARNAHDGGRVHCAAVGADGHLFTGGDDKLVRRWQLGSLVPAKHEALYCHNHSVRALATGPQETLVSGDSAGELAIWHI